MCRRGTLFGYNFDPDEVFAYSTARTVRIRDHRLGLLMLGVQLSIFVYVVIVSLLAKQGYLVLGDNYGNIHFSIADVPSISRASPRPCYCLGSCDTASAAQYTLYTNATTGEPYYQYIGPQGPGIPMPRQQCLYMDSFSALPDTMVYRSTLVPTALQQIDQVLTGGPECVSQPLSSNCSYVQTQPSNQSLVADAEWYLLEMQHSFGAVEGNGVYVRSNSQMQGVLLDINNNPLDICALYPGGECPPGVGIGYQEVDRIPVQALLLAAGISSLDLPSAVPPGSGPPAQDAGEGANLDGRQNYRQQGIIIYLEALYTNFALPGRNGIPFGTGTLDSGIMRYGFRARNVQEDRYSQIVTTGQLGSDGYPGSPGANRSILVRPGVKVYVTQNGVVGTPSFDNAILTLVLSLGMMSIATTVVDFLALNCCKLKGIYRQYKTRTTIDMEDIRQEHSEQLLQQFDQDPYLIDPVPPILSKLEEARRRRIEERVALLNAAGGTAHLGSFRSPGETFLATLNPDGSIAVASPTSSGAAGSGGMLASHDLLHKARAVSASAGAGAEEDGVSGPRRRVLHPAPGLSFAASSHHYSASPSSINNPYLSGGQGQQQQDQAQPLLQSQHQQHTVGSFGGISRGL